MSDCIYGEIKTDYKDLTVVETAVSMGKALFVNDKIRAFLLIPNKQLDVVAGAAVATVPAEKYLDAEISISEDEELTGKLLFVANSTGNDYSYYDDNPTAYDSDNTNGLFYQYRPERVPEPVDEREAGYKIYRESTLLADPSATIGAFAEQKAAAFLAIDQGEQDGSDLGLPIYNPLTTERPIPDPYVQVSKLTSINCIINPDTTYTIVMRGSVEIYSFRWVLIVVNGENKQMWTPFWTSRVYYCTLKNGAITDYVLDSDVCYQGATVNVEEVYNYQYHAAYRHHMNGGYYADSATKDIYNAAGELIGNVGLLPKCITQYRGSYIVASDVEIMRLSDMAVLYQSLICNARLCQTGKVKKIQSALEALLPAEV